MKCNWTYRSGLTWFYRWNKLTLKDEKKWDEHGEFWEMKELCEIEML